jgi:hypothetical protein
MQPKPMAFDRVLLVSACLALFTLSAGARQDQSPQSAVQPRITQPVDEANRIALKGNTHPLARPEFDRGPAPANLPLNRMLLVLSRSPEQEAALEAMLDQQQDKSSPNYHNWLTPEQFGQQFGPADQDVQAVTSWLQTHGFQVNRVSKGRVVIEFSGTASQLQEAFHTEIHRYAVNGEEHWANSSDPQIPAALAPVVAGVASLNGFPRHPMIHVDGTFSKSKATGEIKPVKPLLTINGAGCGVKGNCYGLGPFDFATIYNVSPLWTAATPIDGTGQTIAIVGETDINPQDITSFRTFFGMAAPNLNIVHDGVDPGILTDGEETEADLDVEWSGAVAKGATIDFVVSASTETAHGIDLSAEYIIDNNLAPVMSESYGECELGIGTTGNQFFSQLWQQAAAQGITVFISAGDNGSAGCDNFDATTRPAPAEFGLQVSGYASTPYNVAVGGTDFNDALNPGLYWSSTNAAKTQESAISYIPEEAWNNTCTNGIFASLGFTANAEANCNNSQLVNFVSTIGGSGGKSGCTNSSGQQPSTCSGGYAKPSWQTGAGVPTGKNRDIPDVSLYAAGAGSPSGVGYIVCEADATSGSSCDPTNPNTQFFLVGGTSASSPSFAGIMALINQKTSSRQGNANYVFYKIPAQAGASCTSAPNPPSACIFYDTPAGSTNAMPCAAGSDPTCVVKTSGDQFGVLSGYNTTAGYDSATGLGSVNVTNLVNQWSTFAGQFKGTKTTLVLTPPATPTHGQPWTVTASVSPQSGSGTPTGTVTLIADTGASGQDALSQVFQLVGGSLPAGTTTAFLPGGNNYKVTAHYSGDETFAASDSSPVTVTVNPESSKTFANLVALDVNGNPTSFSATSATYGSGSYLFRVDVGGSGAAFSASTGISSACSNQTASCPTGTVTVNATGAPLGTGSLPLSIRGYAEIQSLPSGSYSISANYPGDASYGPSSANASFTVNKAPTTLSGGAGSPAQYGNQEGIVAELLTTSNGVEPTGTFSFFLDGAPFPTSALVYEGFPYQPNTSPPADAYLNATGTAAFLSLGNHTLTVQYSGDENYAASTSPPSTISVTKGQPEISGFGAVPPTINLGQQTTLSAQLYTYGSGLPPTGTMTFYDGTTTVSGPITYTSEPEGLTASMPYVPNSVGTHSITVSYSGDANYLSATSGGGATLTVIGPDFIITPQPISTTVTAGNPATYSLGVAGSDGFTGNVSVTCALTAAATTCAANPASVAAGVSTTITVTTIAHQLVRPMPFSYPVGPQLRITPLAVLLALILALLALRMHFTRRRFAMSIPLGTVLLLIFLIESCGGGSYISPPPPPHGTQAGSYTVTITGTSGNLTHTTTVSLTVQ